MVSKQEKMEAAASDVGERLKNARTPRPKRKAFTVLAGDTDIGFDQGVSSPGHDLTDVAEAADVLAGTTVAEVTGEGVERPAPVEVPAGPAAGSIPSWKELCLPPARRGTAGMQRRFNVPVPYSVIQLLNGRDQQQVGEGLPKINRSALFAAAVDTYAQAQDYWVDEWESGSSIVPATTSLQGRVDDEVLESINRLRYVDGPTGVRVVNAGPVLALMIERILNS